MPAFLVRSGSRGRGAVALTITSPFDRPGAPHLANTLAGPRELRGLFVQDVVDPRLSAVDLISGGGELAFAPRRWTAPPLLLQVGTRDEEISRARLALIRPAPPFQAWIGAQLRLSSKGR